MGGKGCLLTTLSLEVETVAWEGEIVDLWRENLLASRGLDFLPSTLPPHRTPKFGIMTWDTLSGMQSNFLGGALGFFFFASIALDFFGAAEFYKTFFSYF